MHLPSRRPDPRACLWSCAAFLIACSFAGTPGCACGSGLQLLRVDQRFLSMTASPNGELCLQEVEVAGGTVDVNRATQYSVQLAVAREGWVGSVWSAFDQLKVDSVDVFLLEQLEGLPTADDPRVVGEGGIEQFEAGGRTRITFAALSERELTTLGALMSGDDEERVLPLAVRVHGTLGDVVPAESNVYGLDTVSCADCLAPEPACVDGEVETPQGCAHPGQDIRAGCATLAD